MKIAVLFSGGKDSTRTVHWCLQNGYNVKHLVSFVSERSDSYMFHIPNIHLTDLAAKAIGIKLIKKKVSGIKEKEVEEMKTALAKLDVEGIACGGIASNYQKTRIENVCNELDFEMISPFWGTDPEKFLRDTVDLGFDVRIVGVSAAGLGKEWLGRMITHETIDDLVKLHKKYKISIVLEGGEGETLVVDGPIFKKRIEIIDKEVIWDNKLQSGYLNVKKARLVKK
ncbi:MAG: TIGR00289 family protein [Fervidobacterium sp.]